jgi:hypothetical protein
VIVVTAAAAAATPAATLLLLTRPHQFFTRILLFISQPTMSRQTKAQVCLISWLERPWTPLIPELVQKSRVPHLTRNYRQFVLRLPKARLSAIESIVLWMSPGACDGP